MPRPFLCPIAEIFMEKTVNGLVALFRWIGAAALAGMMFLTCADVVMRGAGHPIWGAVEAVGFLATLALACSMPHTHVARGHAAVDMIVRKLPPRVQAGLGVFTGILSVMLFAAIAWKCLTYADNMRTTGQVSMTLEFPTYILSMRWACLSGVLCLNGLMDVQKSWRKAVKP